MSIRKIFMSHVRPVGLAVALCFALAPAAQAQSNLSPLLTYDGPLNSPAPVPTQGGGEDKLQDDSLSAIDNNDGSVLLDPITGIALINPDTGGTYPTFTVGDTIYGIATLSDISASTIANYTVGVNEQIAILFALDHLGTKTVGPTTVGILGVATGAHTLAALCGTLCTGVLKANSVAVVLSSTDTSIANDPLNWNAAAIAANFATWTWEQTLGLEDDSFFEFVDGGLLGSTERAALAVTAQRPEFGGWLKTDVSDFAGAVHENDVTLDKGEVQFAGADANSRGWAYTDQATFYVNPTAIPEPGSLALIGIALAGLGGTVRRRRKQQ